MQWAQNLGQRLRGYTTPADGPEQAAAQQRQQSARRGGGGADQRTQGQAPSGMSIGSLVQQATSEMLMGPDWGANMELIDAINRGGVRGHGHAGEHALKNLKKPLTGSNPHVQILALTAIEACMKNCGPEFHQKFAFSDTWAAIQMMAGKSSTDTAVSNKALEMIEDWAAGLTFPTFHDAYDGLKRKGVNFPPHKVATPEDFAAAQLPPPTRAAAGGSPQQIPDGVSEEDRRAIQAAMAEFEAEAPRPQAQGPRPPGEQPWHLESQPAGYQPPAQEAVLGLGPAAAAAQPTPPPAPQYNGPSLSASQPAEQLMADLEAAKGMVGLLEEMLKNVPADNAGLVMEDHVTEVADQVVGMRQRLQELAETCTEEQALMTTLGVAERVEAALLQRDQLVAAAAGGAVAPPPPPPANPGAAQPPAIAAAAVPHTEAPRLAAPPRSSPQDAPPLINLMDDEGSAAPPAGAASSPTAASGATFDPFLPMSTNAQQPTPDGSAHAGLLDSFEQLTTGGAAAAPSNAAAEADLFDGLTMGSTAGGAEADAKGKAPADPFAGQL